MTDPAQLRTSLSDCISMRFLVVGWTVVSVIAMIWDASFVNWSTAGLHGALWVLGLAVIALMSFRQHRLDQLRQHEAAVRCEQAAFYKHLIDHLPHPVFYKDTTGRYQGCNAAFETFLGLPRERIIGHTAYDLAPRELADIYHAKDAELLARGGNQDYQTSVRYADGSLHEVQFSKKVFADTQGNTAGLLGIMFDVTERRNTEVALRASEERFRVLCEASPFGVLQCDIRGRTTFVNDRWCTITGLDKATATAEGWFHGIHPDDRAHVALAWADCIKNQLAFSRELRFQCSTGTVRRVSAQVIPIRSATGDVTGFVGAFEDITERKLTEERLCEQHERLELTLHATHLGLWSLDLLTGQRRFDAQTCACLGLDVATFAGTAEEFFAIVHPIDQQLIKDKLDETIRNDKLYAPEYRVIWPDGSVHTVTARGKLFRDATGRPIRLDGVVWDITEAKRVAADLSDACERAEAANRAKSQFLATMGHEIRTPLNGVIGMTGLLLRSELTADQKQMVELVQVSGQNLLTVINDVLDMAKLESGTMKLEHTSMDVRQLAEQTHGMFAPAARHKGIALDLHISSDLPPTMIGDTLRLRQVMNNLLGNAVKFTDHGRVALELEPGPSGQNAPTLVITVRDTGHGIPAHFMPRLFSAFSQGDSSTTRSHGGSGLGLALVKRLVDLMGGTVTATSTPGIGTCFRVVIPTMKHDIPATLLTVAPPPSLARPNPPLILLVEDNPANQQVTGMLLTEMGYRHQVAGNAVEALATMEKQTFDAVLLDCHLPGRNGFEIVGDIRAKTRLQARHLPIIAVTASAQDDDRRRCRAAGMDDFLAKPFTYEALEICLMRWLGPGG